MVHGCIGIPEKYVLGCPVAGKGGDTDAEGHEDFMIVKLVWPGGLFDYPGGNLGSILFMVETGQQNGEFVSTQAGHYLSGIFYCRSRKIITLPYAANKALGHFLKKLVATAMPESVIDAFEVVDIDQHQAE
jgi:hypothetical protein